MVEGSSSPKGEGLDGSHFPAEYSDNQAAKPGRSLESEAWIARMSSGDMPAIRWGGRSSSSLLGPEFEWAEEWCAEIEANSKPATHEAMSVSFIAMLGDAGESEGVGKGKKGERDGGGAREPSQRAELRAVLARRPTGEEQGLLTERVCTEQVRVREPAVEMGSGRDNGRAGAKKLRVWLLAALSARPSEEETHRGQNVL